MEGQLYPDECGKTHNMLLTSIEVFGEQVSAEVCYTLDLSLVEHVDDFFDDKPTGLPRS